MFSGLITLLLGIFRMIFPAKSAAVTEGEQLGATQEGLKNVEAGEQAVVDARTASDKSLLASAADPDSVRAPDPDSRD